MQVLKTYEYDEISVEQWVKILQDSKIMTDKMKQIIAILSSRKDKKLNATIIAELLGYTHFAPINSIVGGCGRKIKEQYAIPHQVVLDYHGHWLVIFNGDCSIKDKKKVFNWVLKKNMLVALKKLDFFQQDEALKEIVTKKTDQNALIQQQIELQSFTASEREAIVKVRVGQMQFKEQLKRKYCHCCCLCQLDIEGLLIASHIKPWSLSSVMEKADVYNGLLLCSNHDALFDKYLISFDDAGQIMIAPEITVGQYPLLNLHTDMKIQLLDEMRAYMAHHREKFTSKYSR